MGEELCLRQPEKRQDEKTYAIIGAAMKVHNELGMGFLEAIYQDALEIEFRRQCIPFVREQQIPVFYDGQILPTMYKVDFVCYDSILVELKALNGLTTREVSQVLNYLKATQMPKALLINFGEPRLTFQRFVGAAYYQHIDHGFQ